MARTLEATRRVVLVGLYLLVGILGGILAAAPAEAQTFTGVQGQQPRITLGFQVKSDALQAMLRAPWQLNPAGSGALKGANFSLVLTDFVRDDDPEGKPKYTGANPVAVFTAPVKHPQTGQTAVMILGGFASNPAFLPGPFKNFRQATVGVEHATKTHELDAQQVTDVWTARDAAGAAVLELRLQSLRKVGARTRGKGESTVISGTDPAVWRIYKFDVATDVVKSVPQGIDRVQAYSFRLTAPELATLFDGSEQLIGITAAPWYVRQVFEK